MSDKKTAVVIGASSGVGRAMARELAYRGYRLVLVARDRAELDILAGDLRIRAKVEAVVSPLDLAAATTSGIQEFVARCAADHPAIERVAITAGQVSDDDQGPTPLPLLESIVKTNYLAVIELVAGFARHMEQHAGGTIAVCSSIAAATPRGRNTVYSSAKAGLETYCRGLQHHYRDTPVRIQAFALGYVDTAMSFGQKLLFPAASAEDTARYMADKMSTDFRVGFYPRFWRPIVMVLAHLPWGVYKRMKF
ncbi:MAG: SDR family NAD(P)-dependent oxidoreductase [Spartobacteria bacterium]|nr:SDR family NAD(P)-dependent oxidoreductase [Spartobacteria bacterium]